MKRLIPVILILILIFTACGGSKKTDSGIGGVNPNSQSSAEGISKNNQNTASAAAINISPKKTESPTLSTVNKDGKSVFNYQGYIGLDITGITDISKIEVKNIAFADNKNGTPTMHKAGKDIFGPQDIKNIEFELRGGRKYDSISYDRQGILIKDGTNTILLQYLIMGVPSSIKKEEVKRKTTMTVECYDAGNNITATKNVEVIIP